MSVVINANLSADIAANNLAYSSARLQKSLNRLSSGSKIVNPSDDAGGLAVSEKLTATVDREGDLLNNLSNATSFAQTQDGALQVAASILNRVSELKTLAADPTKNASDLANYDSEFSQLKAELGTLGDQALNGISLFATSSGQALSVATTDTLASSEAVSLSQQNLLGTTTSAAFSPFSDNFSSLGNWTTTGTVSVSGGSLYLSGSDVTSKATTTQSFSGSMRINFNVFVPGTGDSFSVTHGADTLVTLSGAGNITRMAWHSVEVDLDATGTAKTYIDGASSALVTRSGLGTAAGAIGLSDFGLGAAQANSFSVTSTAIAPTNTASVVAASGRGSLSLSTVTGALQDVATMRAVNGAEQSRLNFTSTMLMTNKTNLQSAISNISDVDVAAETTNLARWNVLVQAGTSMLTQANQSAQMALKLITG